MKLLTALISLSLLTLPALPQESITYFKEEAIPFSEVSDVGIQGFHRYKDHQFGFFHLYQSMDGKQWARIVFSNGSRNINLFYAALICKDTSGNVVDVSNFNCRLGPAIGPIEHHYTFRVTCPGSWTVGWGFVKPDSNYIGEIMTPDWVALSDWVRGSPD